MNDDIIPAGMIVAWSGGPPPPGWLPCDGSFAPLIPGHVMKGPPTPPPTREELDAALYELIAIRKDLG